MVKGALELLARLGTTGCLSLFSSQYNTRNENRKRWCSILEGQHLVNGLGGMSY